MNPFVENVLAAVDACRFDRTQPDSAAVTKRTQPHLPRHKVISILGSLKPKYVTYSDENGWELTATGDAEVQEIVKKASS